MEPLDLPLWFLYAVPTPLTVVLLVKLGLPREPAFRLVAGGLARAAMHRRARPVLLLGVGVIAVNSLQSIVDPHVTAWLGYDLTPRVRALEGDLVERMQAPVADSWAAAAFLTWAYVAAYVALLIAPLFVYGHLGRTRAVAEHTLAFAANYLLALPFYLFVPVAETAWSGHSDAVPLMERVVAGISAQMRYESALDNCFPSLHVSCATAALWVAVRHGTRGLTLTAWVVWALTVYGVMALGVHWGLDVAAGLPFGVLAGTIGASLAHRVEPPDRADRTQRAGTT